MTGFVIDYSLIKNITKNLIIKKFDHKTLNLRAQNYLEI